jgi:hypothetical protein
MMECGKETSKNLLNNYCLLSIGLNILTICFEVAYFIIPIQSIFLDIFGIVLVLSWLVNILIIHLDDKYLNKSSEIGRSLNKLTYYNIIFFIIGIFLILLSMVISNFLLIGDFSLILTIFMNLDLFMGLVGIAMFGIYLAMKTLSHIEKRGVFNFE